MKLKSDPISKPEAAVAEFNERFNAGTIVRWLGAKIQGVARTEGAAYIARLDGPAGGSTAVVDLETDGGQLPAHPLAHVEPLSFKGRLLAPAPALAAMPQRERAEVGRRMYQRVAEALRHRNEVLGGMSAADDDDPRVAAEFVRLSFNELRFVLDALICGWSI